MSMEIVAQVAGVAGFIVFFLLSFKFFAKEKYPTSVMFGLLAAVCLFCSFPWFQGLAKTLIMSKVNSQLELLGKQVNTIQATTATMQNELGEHQKELAAVQGKIRTNQTEVLASQTDITNQYRQLKTLQAELLTAQTNLDAQARKLEDVEYWVNNLFSKTTTERIAGDDTNKVCYLNGKVFFKLANVPIPHSIQLLSVGSDGPNMPIIINQEPLLNVFAFAFSGDWNKSWKTRHYIITYIKDARQTNMIYQMEIGTNELILDHSIHFPVP